MKINSDTMRTPPLQFSNGGTPDPAVSKAASDLFNQLNHYRSDHQKFNLLNMLWVDSTSMIVPGDVSRVAKSAQKLPSDRSSKCNLNRAIRIELTKLILGSSPSMSALSTKFNALLNSSTFEPVYEAPLFDLICDEINAHEMAEQERRKVAFSSVYQAPWSNNPGVNENIQAALETRTASTGQAGTAVTAAQDKFVRRLDDDCGNIQQKIRKTDKHMLSSVLSWMMGHVRKSVGYLSGRATVADGPPNSAISGRGPVAMPASSGSPGGWVGLNGRMQNYISQLAASGGEPSRSLLQAYTPKLPELLDSFRVYSEPAIDIQEKMKSGATDGNTIHPTLRPGNQAAVAMRTPLMTGSGQVRDVVVLSCVIPAPGHSDRPGSENYVSSVVDEYGVTLQRLDQMKYVNDLNTLANHVLRCARDNPGERIVLSADMLPSLPEGLSNTVRQAASGIANLAMAELVRNLRRMGKQVAFADDRSPSVVMQGINNLLRDSPVTLTGAIPGDWIKDGDLIVAARNPRTLGGSDQAQDNSVTGRIGRNSLLPLMHRLHSAAFAEGVMLGSGYKLS